MFKMSRAFLTLLLVFWTAACSPPSAPEANRPSEKSPTKAPASVIAVDGSSTVFPITEAVAEEFQKTSNARVTVGISGTGGGFKKFCAGETVVADASRPIKPEEVSACAAKGIEYIELPIAFDGLAVVANLENTWLNTITVAQLKTMWEPEAQAKITRWNQIDASWPDEELHLFGAGVDSGTYDYFTQAIVGTEHSSRGDFTASEDDNVLVQGIATDKFAIGFFGLAYYLENKDKLKLISVDDGKPGNGAGGILPSHETVANSTYQPLSRPIFIYVSKSALESRPEVSAFLDFYLANAAKLTEEVGYIALPPSAYELVAARAKQRVTGSVFAGKGSQVGVTIESLLGAEGSASANSAGPAVSDPAPPKS